MNQYSRTLFVVVLALLNAVPTAAQEDYGFLWWAHGWRGSSPEGARILCVQTNHYGLTMDVNHPNKLRYGAVNNAKPYATAAAAPNNVVLELPEATLSLHVEVEGETYTCTRAAENVGDSANYPVRLIESGQVVQRFDIHQLRFEREDGTELSVEGRLEVIAWPDRVHFLLEIPVAPGTENARPIVSLVQADMFAQARGRRSQAHPERPIQASMTWPPTVEAAVRTPKEAITVLNERTGTPVESTYDNRRGYHNIALPESVWSWAEEPDRQDRFSVRIVNPRENAVRVPINFAIDGKVSGMIGMCPILLDSDGQPTGIPVQVSKNWHRQAGKTFLYEGPWFHGFSQIEVGPGATWEGELVLVYALWGGIPAASHAQLSLIGWGTNQRWDQVAIGSWGEMFCYDPDVNLNRSMIDDIRPLMVNGMHDNGPWQWTVNVGGGDFLVYFNEAGEKQYLSRMRTAYLEPGPNLTRTVYAGQTPGGELEARIEVSSPRCDDVSRAFHTFRYDIKKPMKWSRLAFYQFGADNYNDHQFGTIARGNEAGLIEDWEATQGGKTYHRTDIPCEGEVPWFSLHDGQRSKHHPKGAWANRGLIIRRWEARLGGKDVPRPTAAIYGTDNGVPSALVELSPPPGCTELLPGDFVKAEVEFVVIPAEPNTYYGPNKPFKEHLEANINTWKPVHRLATMNHEQFAITKGTLRRSYPIEIAVEKDGEAALNLFRIAGYVPVTFTGLSKRNGHRLSGIPPAEEGLVQIAYDDESKTWSRTYNVNSDALEKGMLWLRPRGEE